jgi:hypothetical protein
LIDSDVLEDYVASVFRAESYKLKHKHSYVRQLEGAGGYRRQILGSGPERKEDRTKIEKCGSYKGHKIALSSRGDEEQ